ncbi:uncharacterized protein VTP21DRAFT_6092 [Calcarisporiella thermophila]|uniref:uncharacterized protein n=1 Tax=Calcarisporiella thermophila TaxID=911321 RepID=UPI0037420935
MSDGIICLVRALYDYHSSDPSALSFKKGATIEVLAQLQSGWWDGIMNGERGWFPSNYVELLEDESDDENISVITSVSQIHEKHEEEKWIRKTTPDGVVFYENTKTGQSAWEPPADAIVVPPPPPPPSSKSSANGARSRSNSFSSNAAQSVRSARRPPMPNPWIVQQAPDGSNYFYNKITQEVSSRAPSSINGDSASDMGELDSMDYSHHHMGAATLPRMEDHHRAACVPSPSPHHNYPGYPQPQPNYLLPPNWVRKVNQQGRVYFHNVVTEETAWSMDMLEPHQSGIEAGYGLPTPPALDITPSPTPGEFLGSSGSRLTPNPKRTSPYPPPLAARSPSRNRLHAKPEPPSHPEHEPEPEPEPIPMPSPPPRTKLLPHNEEVTWIKLATSIAMSIHGLTQSLRAASPRNKPPFVALATAVVDSIRIMLMACGCVSKDSPVILRDKELQTKHRIIIATVSRLVLSARVAGGQWPPADAIARVQRDAGDVLAAVRNFVSLAQETGVEVRNPEPKLVDGPRALRKGADNAGVGSIGQLEQHARSVVRAHGFLVAHVRKMVDQMTPSAFPIFGAVLFAQVRQWLTQLTLLITVVEEAPDLLTGTDEFPRAKQAVFNALGGLIMAAQAANEKTEVMEQILRAAEHADQVVKRLLGVLGIDLEDGDRAKAEPKAQPSPGRNTLSQIEEVRSVADFDEDGESDLDGLEKEIMRQLESGNSDDDVGIASMQYAEMYDQEDGEISSDSEVSVRHPSKDGAELDFFGKLDFEESHTFMLEAGGLVGEVDPEASEGAANGEHGDKGVEDKDRPWFLGYDYGPEDVVFNSDGVLRGGTLKALVERLTMHDVHDANFMATFLLTYRSFTTTHELFEMLKARFLMSPPDGLSPGELAVWNERKLTPVRLRVFNVIKNWLENYYQDEEDARCLPSMREFAVATMHEYMALPAAQLVKLIDKRMQSTDGAGFRKMISTQNVPPPPPILPKNLRKFKLLELDPLEVARQLTLMDSRLYNKIRPVECLDKAWSNGESGDVAPNVRALIEQSNQITGWVAECILMQVEIKKRAAYIKHFVSIAEKCSSLNNFNTCMAIVAALDSSAIFRLRRTWDLVNQKTQQTLNHLKKLINSAKNFAEYREVLRLAVAPCVPFLGVYLTDLTFITDGNPNSLKPANLINFSKRAKTAEVIREIQRYQLMSYNLAAVPELQQFLRGWLQSSRPVEELYPLSLELEPRERDDEKIARLLHESGFT